MPRSVSQTIYQLVRVAGLSEESVAVRFGITVDQVRQHLEDARNPQVIAFELPAPAGEPTAPETDPAQMSMTNEPHPKRPSRAKPPESRKRPGRPKGVPAVWMTPARQESIAQKQAAVLDKSLRIALAGVRDGPMRAAVAAILADIKRLTTSNENLKARVLSLEKLPEK